MKALSHFNHIGIIKMFNYAEFEEYFEIKLEVLHFTLPVSDCRLSLKQVEKYLLGDIACALLYI